MKSMDIDSFAYSSKEEIARYKSKLNFDLPRDSMELNMEVIKDMVKKMKITQYIKSIQKSQL